MEKRSAKERASNKGSEHKMAKGNPAKEALLESEALYEHLADALPEPVVILQDDRYQFVNPAFTRLFGYTRQDLDRGLSFLETIQEHDKRAARQRYKDRLAGKQLPKTNTIDLMAKDGTLVPCETSATMIQYQGRPADLVIIRDITERKQAEEALHERIKELGCLYGISKLKDDPDRDLDEFFRETVNLIPAAWQYPDLTCGRIIFGDREFRTDNYRETSWKQSAAITVGAKKVGVIEVFCLEERPDIDEGPFLKEERALIDTLAREIGNYVLRKQADEKIRKLNRELEKRVRRRTRELEAVNSELESFVYSVSHDLRAPLRAMDGFSEALAEDYAEVLDEKAITYIKRVQRASRKMGQLIDDLLSLSQVSRGELNLQKFDFSALAESVMSDLCQAHPERQVQVSIEPNLVDYGDLRLLRIVLYNLLDNAWKFTGKVDEAKIEFGRIETDRGPAFFVRDNGVGFDMRYVHKLFGAFQRLHSESEFEGTGIGLATVARIIGRHGGQSWGEGKVGRGATFYFTLPETTRDYDGQESHLIGGRQSGRR